MDTYEFIKRRNKRVFVERAVLRFITAAMILCLIWTSVLFLVQ